MPKIPRTQPTLNRLTNKSPQAVRRDPGAKGEIMRAAGEAFADASRAFKEAALVAERTKAQNVRDTRIAEIEAEAKQDPDLSEERRKFYDDQIDNAINESAKNIGIPGERQRFELDSKSRGSIGKAKIAGDFMNRTVDRGRANADVYFNNKKDEFVSASSPGLKQTAILERDRKLQEYVSAGYFSQAQAVKMQEEMRREWGKAQVEYDIMTNPTMARDILTSNAYPNIDEQERVELLSKAEKAVDTQKKNQERTEEKQMIETEAKIIQSIGDPENNLTPQQISDLVVSKRIRPELGEAVINAMLNPVEEQDFTDNDAAFVDLFDGILRAENPKAVNDSLIDVLNGFGKSDLSRRNMKLLIQTAYAINKPEEKGFFSSMLDGMRNVFDGIDFFSKRNAEAGDIDGTKARLQREVMRDFLENKTPPDEAFRKAKESEMKKYMKGISHLQPGSIFKSKWGINYQVLGVNEDGEMIVGPPGSIKPVKEK